MPSRPDLPASAADAVIVVVDDWRGTFGIPDDAEHRLHAGPRWLVPMAGVLGSVLAVALLSWARLSPGVVWLIGAAVFLASVASVTLHLGGSRGEIASIAGATAGWVPLASAFSAQADLDISWAVVLVAVGVLGQVVGAERLRVRLARDRDAVVAGRRGTRFDGWIVAVAGPPWDKELRVEPSDGSGVPLSGRHAAWRVVRPGVGHPVGIWRADPAGAPAVVLLPRVVR